MTQQNNAMEERIKYDLIPAILGALEHRGFYDCGKYLDDDFFERIIPVIIKEINLAEQLLVERIRDNLNKHWDKLEILDEDKSTENWMRYKYIRNNNNDVILSINNKEK